jgi:hypothetical protein
MWRWHISYFWEMAFQVLVLQFLVLYCQTVSTKYDIEGPRFGARPKFVQVLHTIKKHISKMWRWHISYFWEMVCQVVVL